MPTILFAWELGANLGHLIPLARIAQQLDSGHHRTIFAVRDLANAQAVLGTSAQILQAPVWPSHRNFGASAGALASYVDVLAAVGFADPAKLAVVATAWRSLLDMTKPDVVVADHSPALQVALFGAGRPLITVGTGFTMPPLDYDSFPPLRGDLAPVVPESRLFESARDARALMGAKRPGSLIDVFRATQRIVFGLPELDPYQAFRREPIVAPPGGLPGAMPWPKARRLFVYAGADMHNFDVLLQALATIEVPVEAYLRGDAAPAREFLRLREAVVHDAPPALSEVLRGASHVLTQGGATTTAAAYSAGRPQLISPPHPEAEINLDLVRRAGVGRGLNVSSDPAAVVADLIRFLGDPGLPDNALEAANRITRRTLPDGSVIAADAIRAALG